MKALGRKNGTSDTGILVDRQILRAIKNGWLGIDPFEAEALEPATYDLRVGQFGVVSTASQPVDLREQRVLTIEPFSIALLQTEEVLRLSSRMVGRVGPRSNVMRHGIFASTGPQIDPGFEGRLFVTLLNVTDHAFLIHYLERFLTIEFHGLSEEPSKTYSGPHQGKTEPSIAEINAILSRGGPLLRDIHRDMLELQGSMRETAVLGRELPRLIELQNSTLEGIMNLSTTARVPSLFPTAIVVPVSTFIPEPYEMLREMSILVQPAEEGFTATYFDANISTSGDTQEEAVSNLKSLLLEIYEDLEQELPENLGPEPKRQLAVLRNVIRKVQ